MVTCTIKFGCICYHTLGKIVMFCIIGNVNPNFFQIFLVLLHPSKWNEKHIIFQMRGREPKGKKWRNDFLLYFANVKFTFILHYDCVRRLYITGKDQIFADFSRNSILFLWVCLTWMVCCYDFVMVTTMPPTTPNSNATDWRGTVL